MVRRLLGPQNWSGNSDEGRERERQRYTDRGKNLSRSKPVMSSTAGVTVSTTLSVTVSSNYLNLKISISHQYIYITCRTIYLQKVLHFQTVLLEIQAASNLLGSHSLCNLSQNLILHNIHTDINT